MIAHSILNNNVFHIILIKEFILRLTDMGLARKKQHILYDTVRKALSDCKTPVLEYPPEENEGVLRSQLQTIIRAYNSYEKETKTPPKIKIKMMDQWIASFDRETNSGNIINIETKIISLNLSSKFRQNMEVLLTQQMLKDGASSEEINRFLKGQIIYYSLIQYCLYKLFEKLPRATEATVSQAIYYPKTDTFDAGYPVTFGKELALKKESFKNYTRLNLLAGKMFYDYFKEETFSFYDN